MTDEDKAEFYSLTPEQRERHARNVAAAITKHYAPDRRTRSELLAEIASLEERNAALRRANRNWKISHERSLNSLKVANTGWKTTLSILETELARNKPQPAPPRPRPNSTPKPPEPPRKQTAWQAIRDALLG